LFRFNLNKAQITPLFRINPNTNIEKMPGLGKMIKKRPELRKSSGHELKP